MAFASIHRFSPILLIVALAMCPLSSAQEATAELELSPLAIKGPVPEPIEPVDQKQLLASIERGAKFLVDDQRENGAWGSAEQTKGLNIFAPIPGAHHAFRAAVTGLAVEALVEVEPHLDGELKQEVTAAIERGETWLLENADQVRRATMTAIYNNWGHAYSIAGLSKLHRRAEGNAKRQAALKIAIEVQLDKLERYEFVNGGWGYYDFEQHTQSPAGSPNSFTTGTVLVALHKAKQVGVEIPERLVERAMTSIVRQRNPDFTYAYGEYLMMTPMRGINRAGGSLGRSQNCNLALRLWGDEKVTDEVIKTWLNRLYARNGWLSIGRKRPIPHESHFAVAGYFYYYGHYYAAGCIELLPSEEQPYFQDHLAAILMPLQEKDGSWWDYPFYNYHQQYGTAMALTSLEKCLKD